MTEADQLSNITVANASIFTYITSFSISPFCPHLPHVPIPVMVPDLGFHSRSSPIGKRAGSLQLRY